MARLSFLCIGCLFIIGCNQPVKDDSTDKYWVYVSSFSDSLNGAGIGIYDWNPESGDLISITQDSGVYASSYLAIDKNGERLYSVNKEGMQAFSIEKSNGTLDLINTTSHAENNAGACYVSLTKNEKHLLVAYYGSGTVASYAVDAGTGIGDQVSQIIHTGSSIDTTRQEGPHAHMVLPAPIGELIVVTDLGTDKVYCYRIDENGVIDKDPVSETVVPLGFGPRHVVFHPSQPYIYVLAELKGHVLGYEFDSQNGIGKLVSNISILPEGFDGFNKSADIHINPEGDFLYASNRGDNSIAVCKINQATGELSVVDIKSSGGITPRAFAVDPSGDYMLVANRQSDQISILKMDKDSGVFQKTGEAKTAPFPQCIRFVKQ